MLVKSVCWWKKVCWWRISVMLVKGMLVKESIFMYVGEACWWRKLCMLVKNFLNVGEIIMLVKNLLLRCWWKTDLTLVKDVDENFMLVKMCMLVKSMLVKTETDSFYQHTVFTNIQFSPTCFTNIRSPQNSVNLGGKVYDHLWVILKI